jgi:hypothetical protein
VDTRYKVECLADTEPAGQHGNVGDEADILHELVALGTRVASEDTQLAVELGEAEDGLEKGRFAGAVGTDQSNDASGLDGKADGVDRGG